MIPRLALGAGESSQIVDLAVENGCVVDALSVVDDEASLTSQAVSEGISLETITRQKFTLEIAAVLSQVVTVLTSGALQGVGVPFPTVGDHNDTN